MNQDYILYYALGMMFIYFIWKTITFLKKGSKGSLTKIHINKSSSATEDEYKKIAVGAILSEQQGAYINSLTTGLDIPSMKDALSMSWNINNNEEAKDTLDYLVNKGHRLNFDIVYKAFQLNSEEEQKKFISDGFDETDTDFEEDIYKAFDQLKNLTDTWVQLTKYNIIQTTDELKKHNNKAWDYGRLAQISRMCYDIGYISEDQAWEYINKAYDMAIQNFDDWKSFSKSYIIGRAMWGGLGQGNEGVMNIAEYLLTEEKSPWVQFDLK